MPTASRTSALATSQLAYSDHRSKKTFLKAASNWGDSEWNCNKK